MARTLGFYAVLLLIGIAARTVYSSGSSPLQYERVRGYKNKLQSFQTEPELKRSFELQSIKKEYQKEVASPKYRLNDSFIPSHYELELLVILDEDPSIGEQFTAPGKVAITFRPTEDNSILRLHAYLLNINQSSVQVNK
jgi:hypothetical protein